LGQGFAPLGVQTATEEQRMNPTQQAASTPSAFTSPTAKRGLWAVMGLMTLVVFVVLEPPYIKREYLHFLSENFFLVPHLLCGGAALVIGPLQFSSRLRQRNLGLHRILGKIYVISVLISAPLGAVMIMYRPVLEVFATDVLVATWIITTVVAFLTARNGHIAQHHQWMIRSYSVTFFFVTDRFPFLFPSFQPSSEANAVYILFLVFLSIFIPDIAFAWREMTSKRK